MVQAVIDLIGSSLVHAQDHVVAFLDGLDDSDLPVVEPWATVAAKLPVEF